MLAKIQKSAVVFYRKLSLVFARKSSSSMENAAKWKEGKKIALTISVLPVVAL